VKGWRYAKRLAVRVAVDVSRQANGSKSTFRVCSDVEEKLSICVPLYHAVQAQCFQEAISVSCANNLCSPVSMSFNSIVVSPRMSP
jgi:hypothetical protein